MPPIIAPFIDMPPRLLLSLGLTALAGLTILVVSWRYYAKQARREREESQPK